MQQAEDFNDHIEAFEKKLELIVVDDISTELYCRKYLAYLLQHKKYFLAIYTDVLNKLIRHSAMDKINISLVDIGTGNGLLGIFAKFCGFNKVYLNDIDPKFIQASGELAMQLGIDIDGYITGDINKLRPSFQNGPIHAAIGTDVVEHIYKLEDFFTGLREINPSMTTVFTTASNSNNYFKVRVLKKMQLKDELEGGVPDDRILFGENAHEAFSKIREKIIRRYMPDLPGKTVDSLVKASRGLNEEDIMKAVEQYKIHGTLPVPAEGTNTCNPLTGSWTERILSLEGYASIYNAAGFRPIFYNGFYNAYGNGFKNFVKRMLNSFIPFLGKRISPYIVIVGCRNK